MPVPRKPAPEPAHDILAAEEFGMPAGDPSLHHEPAHDILAAEAFAVPAPDPALHQAPVTLPEDPTGVAEAHDILAAEEFAMPAPRRSPGRVPGAGSADGSPRALMVAAVGVLIALRLLRRIARRR
jgi:hypothetical protein